jgi:hypothetical protein
MKRLWVLFLLVCLPAPAISAGNIHFGSLEIHPFISLMETYSDNVYATANNTKSDWITTTTPGIRLLMPFRMHTFAAEYKAVINNYYDYTSENSIDHHAAAMADFKFGSRIGLKLRDAYVKGHESRATNAIGELQKFERNAASAAVSYQFADRLQAQVEYTRTNWNFEDYNTYRERDEDLIATSVHYRFLPKTSVFIEYDFRNIVYEEKTDRLDSKVYNPLLGLKWDISERTTGTVKGGYLQKEFEDPNKDNISTWSAFADLTHAFSDRSSFKVLGMRDVNESNVQGTNYYVRTEAFAEYTHKLLYNLSAVARASYGIDDYSNAIAPDPDRHDQRTLGGVGLKYQMRSWLDFALNFNHLDRDSNVDYNDMTENTTSFTINLAL